MHDGPIMRKVWGFSYMTFGAILANLACNAEKAGMACPNLHMKKCLCQWIDKSRWNK